MENDAKQVTLRSSENETRFRYISSFSPEEKRAFLESFDTVFCDCDGVIWQAMSDAIPGSADAVDFLRRQGKKVVFVTNNSMSSPEQQLAKFHRCNITVEKTDIIHPAQTVCDHLKSIQFDGLILCLATHSFKDVLSKEGFKLVVEKDCPQLRTVEELRSAIYTTDPVKCVVIDVDFNLTVSKLMRAQVHLKDPECLFIGGAADSLIHFGGGEVIGPGPFISVVETAARRTATILGKPGSALKDLLKQRYFLSDPSRALFIGDSLTSDIHFGKSCGFQTLLVLSGGTKDTDLLMNLNESLAPDFVATNLHELIELKT